MSSVKVYPPAAKRPKVNENVRTPNLKSKVKENGRLKTPKQQPKDNGNETRKITKDKQNLRFKPKTKDSRSSLRCPWCDQNFEKQQSYAAHIRVHAGEGWMPRSAVGRGKACEIKERALKLKKKSATNRGK
jgi:uncharacterized C2H2 Zn-finger protein